jgi:GNAT superfamily N-acetyltransferase
MGEFEVDEAMVEIQDEPKHMIERKTAKKWAARAIASFIIASQADEPNQIFKRYIEGDDYRHEAIEHASLAEDHGVLVALIETACDKARDKVDLSKLGVSQMEKCESLYKAPMQTEQASPGLLESWTAAQDDKPVQMFAGERHVQTKTAPNGMFHHIYDSSRSHGNLHMGAPVRHILSQSQDPTQPGVAHMYVHPTANKHNEVWGVYVDPKMRGQGLGRSIYDAAIAHHGTLQSGHQVSAAAHKVWESISQDPRYQTKLGAYPQKGKSYHAASRHVTKLAASEKPLEKSPYGPKGMGLYVDADNARRKMTRSSTGANKPTISQQASSQAAKDQARSRKNPVRVYKPHEIKALFRNGFKPLKTA